MSTTLEHISSEIEVRIETLARMIPKRQERLADAIKCKCTWFSVKLLKDEIDSMLKELELLRVINNYYEFEIYK